MIGKVLKWLAGGGLVVAGAIEAKKWWAAGREIYPFAPSTLYTIVVSFKGAGGGGPISSSQLQTMMDSETTGVGLPGPNALIVGSTATDPTKKLVTMVVSAPGGVSLTGSQLANLPAPWAPGRLVSVTNVGQGLKSATSTSGGSAIAGSAAPAPNTSL